ncbi:TonB-dependent receptor [Alsobacter metallidurans]|uniref:TonB-dependent receptor n=1 Tax=Alsobacter metallidurans TaxID=340221 RepID=A0A917I6L2_9HYPH|nr:TonB-dependent siderophore receptor [Alsobacter metallidurans]GGH16671.1 TonB-dependent receptor [Alsobacter metallidurans]
MGDCKRPATLRGASTFSTTRPTGPKTDRSAGVGLLTAAALAGTLAAQEAAAQTATTTPGLTVEAPAEPRKRKPVAAKPTRARPLAAASRPARPAVAAPAQAAAGPGAAGAPGPQAGPSANPYADPAAPFKVDRSASSKLTEPLLNTPRTVTAIPKEVIEEKQATSFRELVRTTPGLTLGSGEGGNAFGDRVFIRGFDARNDIYVDGVRDPGVNIRENFATEQVEVLKGPASTVGGRGTSGGAVNVVTKKPSFVSFYEAGLTGGTDATKRMTFDVNHVVSPEFAVRANGMVQGAGVAGRNEVFDNRWGGAIAATWKPNERFQMTVDYFHVDLDQLPDWGVPFDARKRRPFTESGLNRNNYYGLPNRDFQKAKQDIATASMSYELTDWATLSNKFRYGFSVLDYVASAPGSVNTTNPDPARWTVNSGAKSRYQENEVIANQTELTTKFTTFGLLHTLVSGVEISRENVSRDSYLALSTESFGAGAIPGASLNLWDPGGGLIPFTGTFAKTGRPTEIGVDTRSAYLLDTVNWNDRFFLTGGVRVDDYGIKAASTAATGVRTTLERDDTMFNWNIGATYKPLPFAAVYAAYGTSSNPVGSELDGGGNDYGALTASNAALGPEKNRSYEVGTKWELFDRRLLVTAALFQNEKSRARETIGATVSPTGEYRVRGVEVGVGGNVTDRWSLFGGAVFMDSEVTKSAIAANRGLQLANIAHESFSLLSKYAITDKLSVGAQATYIGRILGGTFAANNNVLPGGWRLDLLAEYKFTDHVSARLNVLNVTDATIYDAFYRSNVPYVYLAPGRAAYFSLNFKY